MRDVKIGTAVAKNAITMKKKMMNAPTRRKNILASMKMNMVDIMMNIIRENSK